MQDQTRARFLINQFDEWHFCLLYTCRDTALTKCMAKGYDEWRERRDFQVLRGYYRELGWVGRGSGFTCHSAYLPRDRKPHNGGRSLRRPDVTQQKVNAASRPASSGRSRRRMDDLMARITHTLNDSIDKTVLLGARLGPKGDCDWGGGGLAF